MARCAAGRVSMRCKPPHIQSEIWQTRLPPPLRDDPLRPWLAEAGSLTARIQERCQHFSVTVIRQALTRPHADEARLLGIRRGALAWVREVVLHADGRAVVFAHSVLPRAGVRGAWRLFNAVGGRPLGAALFADPRIRRGTLAYRRLDARHPLHRAAAGGGAELWARRSLFHRRGKPLLVTEVFLPGIGQLRRQRLPPPIGARPPQFAPR